MCTWPCVRGAEGPAWLQRVLRTTRLPGGGRFSPYRHKLKQDIKALRASSLAAFRACWEHLQDGLSAVEAAVQGAQLCHQALLAWQSKVGQLERSLQEADARYQLEKQKRRVLHNRLVELKGNIRVHCRIRPLLPFDKEFGDPASQDSSVPAGVVHAIDDVSDVPNTLSLEKPSVRCFPQSPESSRDG
ncbi:kinesin-like protein KIF25 isoform X2 [Vulpes lagopus]|uniref:kinesin-like protein KIF25 isoform X2 n=1 Tax=Vulpes lagopus TaxID=494514 RepID=UPI001BC9FC8B|nr:kinesin-like protein KIF25 isoform X2 [Vulpes lagopus]